jgi:hypothetical protein
LAISKKKPLGFPTWLAINHEPAISQRLAISQKTSNQPSGNQPKPAIIQKPAISCEPGNQPRGIKEVPACLSFI